MAVLKALRSAARKLEDFRLNKSGTVGTEPIMKRDKKGKLRKYIEVKAGRLGKLDIPTRDVREDNFPMFKPRPYKKRIN